jgi:hypothetical protein
LAVSAAKPSAISFVCSSELGLFGRPGTEPNFGKPFCVAEGFPAASGFFCLCLSSSSSPNQLTGFKLRTTVRVVSPTLLHDATTPPTAITISTRTHRRAAFADDNIFHQLAGLCIFSLNILCFPHH